MTPTEFLLLALALCAVAVAAASMMGGSRSETEPFLPEVTRWRRFRVYPRELARGDAGSLIVEEEPVGILLRRLAPATEAAPLVAGRDASGPADIALKRRWLSLRPIWTLRLGGRPWLLLRSDGPGGFPAIQPARARTHPSLPDPSALELHGSLIDREYEIRLRGKLAASISRLDAGEERDGPDVRKEGNEMDERAEDEGEQEYPACHLLEIVKSAEPLPLIALALALEIAADARRP